MMLGSGLSNQVGASVAALAFPVIGPVGVVAIRQWMAGAVLLAVGRPRLRSFTARQWRVVLGLAAVFAVMNVSLYTAIDRIGLGLAVTLEFLGPLAVALLGSRRVLDLACALVAAPAVVLLTRPQATTDYLGVGLGLLAAVCWACYILLNRVMGRELPGATGSAAAAGVSGLVYVPVGVIVLWHHPPTLAAAAYAVVAGVLSSAIPFLVDLLTLRRVPAQFFGVFMSVNPVLAALVGLVVLDQHLGRLDWLAIAVIVTANAVAISFGVRRDAAHHSPVPVGRCDVVHGVPTVPLTPRFGKVSADGERRSSRATQ
jgi:inner membrane transporter RhtA